MIIHDGGHGGYKAKVNDDGQVLVASTAQSNLAFLSDQYQDAFALGSPIFPVTATDGVMLWGKNINATDHFHVHVLRAFWNGGDAANYDRVAYATLYTNTPTPTANIAAMDPSGHSGNLNLASIKTPQMDLRAWDGVGTGMTVTGNGSRFFTIMLEKGMTEFKFDGALIMPPNSILALSAQGDVVGKLIVMFAGYFHNNT